VNPIPLQNILAGSRAYSLWLTLFRDSLLRVALAGCRLTISSVINGSNSLNFVRTRIWPLLLVEDYLERPLRLDAATLEGSVVWARLSTTLTRVVSWFGSFRKSCALPESRVLRVLSDICHREPSDLKQLTMAFSVLFIAVYYFFRIILQLWLPTAQYRAGWAAGLVLALLIATSLKFISRR
jgi:hypothetical protein